MRDSVVFYRSFYEAVSALPESEQLEAMRAIIEYGLDGKEPESGVAKALYLMAKPQIDANNKRYENSLKGGRKPKTENKPNRNQTETKSKPKVNQTETKSEPKEKEKEKEKEKVKVKEKDKDYRVQFDRITNLFQESCASLPSIRGLNSQRKTSIKNLLKTYTVDDFETVFRKAESSDFLSGRSGKWRGCGFDWLIKPSNFLKVLEGNYDNRSGTDALVSWAMGGEDGQKADSAVIDVDSCVLPETG